jgi:hypothetical protein
VICGRIGNIGFAIDDDDHLTVAILCDGAGRDSTPRFTITLCPRKMHACRTKTATTRRPAPRPAPRPRPRPLPTPPTLPTDPLIEQICGLKIPLGAMRVWVFDGGCSA